MMTGAVDLDTVFAQAPTADGQDHQLLGWHAGRDDADLLLLFRARWQVGAVPAAHLAARRDGRPDAGGPR